MSDTDEGREYPLAYILGQLARQLDQANQRVVQAGRPGRLRWTQATIELGVTWEKTGDGGVDLKVVRLGGGITKANTTTITVTVVPSGLGPDGMAPPPRVTDVASQPSPGPSAPAPGGPRDLRPPGYPPGTGPPGMDLL